MADITRTRAKVSVVHPESAEIYPYIAAAALEEGQPLYLNSSSKVDLGDANGSGTDTFFGMATEKVGAGQVVSVLKRGYVNGFTLSGAYGAAVYVSNTAGELADAAGSTSLVAGHIVAMSDPARTKVLYINAL